MTYKQKVTARLKKDPLYYTRGVMIETTNRCNYAAQHTRCPMNRMKEKNILPLDAIEKVLIELGELGFSGVIYPFNYSEPLIDPRLFVILRMIKLHVPKAKVWTYTNGFMLDETLLDELIREGLERINISVYDPKDGKYFHDLIKKKKDTTSCVLRAYQRWPLEKQMNDKLFWDEYEPNGSTRPCPSPHRFLNISATGEVVICCHDWQRRYPFGNIKTDKVADILTSDRAIETFVNLSNGERHKYFLCARCNKHR